MSAEPERGAPPATVVNGQLLGADFLKNPSLQTLFSILNRDGEEARAVGGALRNALLGVAVHEVDIATTALPDVVMQRAKDAGLRAIPTGIEHGTVTILIDGDSYEVTTLRVDVETDGRHAKVLFGRSFREDALRRDFTINALSVTPEGTIYDETGGLADLAAGRVRFIGDPQTRIREDYLRSLRFFRFHAGFAKGPLDQAAFDAVILERAGLSNLSRERVRAEILKLLIAPRCVDVVRAMDEAGLLTQLTAGVCYPVRLQQIVSIEAARGRESDAVLRLAALGVAVAEDAERLRDRLRLSNAEADRLARGAKALVSLHASSHPPAARELRHFLFQHGRVAACDAMALAHAESGAPVDDAGWRSAHAFLADTPEPTLPFSGADLLAKGIPAGRGLGEVLKIVQGLWIRAGFPQDPHVLAQLLDEALAQSRARKA